MTHTLRRLALAALFALAAHASLRAQETGQRPPQTPAAPARTSADETFDLDIAERRITEESFAASTAVELGGEGRRGVSVRVGVAVGAERIDVLLRNVRGRVRFRASLEELTRRLGLAPNAHRPPP